MTTNMDDKGAARTTAQDHLRSMLDLMRQGARINLSGIPDDPTFLSSNIPGEIAKEIAALIQSPADAGMVTELHGPYGWLNGHRALNEENWTLEMDPLENSEEYFAIPLYALSDPFREIGRAGPPAALTTPKPEAVKGCATEGCEKPATVRFERHGVGSDYCRECYLKVQAIRSTTYGYDTPRVAPDTGGAKPQHVAYFDDGQFHWMSGIAPRNCELYTQPPTPASGEQMEVVGYADPEALRKQHGWFDASRSGNARYAIPLVTLDSASNALIDLHRELTAAEALNTTLSEALKDADERVQVLGEGLKAGLRAANLALFVIRKNDLMPNSSWQAGFEKDTSIANAALAALPAKQGDHGNG